MFSVQLNMAWPNLPRKKKAFLTWTCFGPLLPHSVTYRQYYHPEANVKNINTHLSSLFVTKNKINPVMQILRNIIGFQSFSVLFDELSCTTFRPRRQSDISNLRKKSVLYYNDDLNYSKWLQVEMVRVGLGWPIFTFLFIFKISLTWDKMGQNWPIHK